MYYTLLQHFLLFLLHTYYTLYSTLYYTLPLSGARGMVFLLN